jgi:hypothetical protein
MLAKVQSWTEEAEADRALRAHASHANLKKGARPWEHDAFEASHGATIYQSVTVTRKETEGAAMALNHVARYLVVPFQSGPGQKTQNTAPQFGVVTTVYSLRGIGNGVPHALVRRIGGDGYLVDEEDSWVCQRIAWRASSNSADASFSPLMLGRINDEKLGGQVAEMRTTGKDAEAVASWHENDLQVAPNDASTPTATGRPKRACTNALQPPGFAQKKLKLSEVTVEGSDGDDDDVMETKAPKTRSPRKICVCSCRCKGKCRGTCKKTKSPNKRCKGKCACKCKCSGTCTCDGNCICVCQPPAPKTEQKGKEKKGQKGAKEGGKKVAKEGAKEMATQALMIKTLQEMLAHSEKNKVAAPTYDDVCAAYEEQNQRMHQSRAKLKVNKIDADIEVALKERQLRLAMLD